MTDNGRDSSSKREENAEEDKEQLSNKRALEDNDDSDRNKRPATEESSKALSNSDSAASAIAAATAETVLKVTVPNSQAGALIGKGGSAIKMVRETSGAKINVSDNSGLDRIVTISGPQTSVQLAYTLINQNIAATAAPGEHTDLKVSPTTPTAGDQRTVKLLIPGSQAGGLIGKGGELIKAIRMESGAYVKVANKDETGNHDERMVTIKGSIQACQKAQQLISAKLLEMPPPRDASTQSQSSNAFTGMAGMGAFDQGMGMYGMGMAGMAGMAGMGNPQGMAGMAGMPGMGNPQGMAGMPGMGKPQATQVQIPNDVMGKVIGKGGTAISEIRTNSCAKIEIAENDPATNMRMITITGTPEQTQMAQYLISLKMVA